MEQIIAPCGNDCGACPRYTAPSIEELQKFAELWYRVEWRDRVETPEEIRCSGCSSHKSCIYGIVECINKKNVQNHHQCEKFPTCGKIKRMLKRTKRYEQRCRALCSDTEFMILKKAFFEKETNRRGTWKILPQPVAVFPEKKSNNKINI
jgi:hypothetical protein